MCGFAGIYTRDSSSPVDAAILERMTMALHHRGPDEGGVHNQAGLGLGLRRLSIIDVAHGQQPIYNEDRSVVAVCNGEIYNHGDLRRRLVQQGHSFRAEVDVEVLVHLYEEHGPAFVEQLNGQFAFALFDTRTRFLMLARDPAGIAPLFYTWRDGTLLFGSEIKALLQHPAVKPAVDLTALDQVLTLPGPVSPRTLFAGVESLPPGQFLAVTPSGCERRTYWDLDYPLRSDAQDVPAPDFDDLERRLRESVARRLQADVPVGFYLSGGLDSSLIAALVHRVDSDRAVEQRHAFSIVFPDRAIDEGRFQAVMAQHVGASHHTTVFDTTELAARLSQMVRHAEAPLKESYNSCSLLLSERVHREGMKVVLTGEGADELFGGYVGYRVNRADEHDGLDDWLERDLRATMWGDETFFYEKHYTRFREVKSAIYSPALAAALSTFDCCRHPIVDPEKIRGRHPIHQRSYVDFKVRLADHLLADHGDRVAYANSVEARYPFLDPNVIAWVQAAPPEWLVHKGIEKFPLRTIARRLLPEAIAAREKFGFVAPSSALLLQSGIEWVEDLLSHSRIKRAGYFNADTVERLKQQYRQPGFDVNTTFDLDLLMLVLTFEIFRECFSVPEA
jgi:asparagine synthase (glutamine-hydrolysing)